jgi:hypothetical protein
MALRSRQLLNNDPTDRAKRHIRLSGLTPTKMSRWANLNLIDWLNHARSGGMQRVLEILDLAQEAHRIAEESRHALTQEEHKSSIVRLNPILSKLNAVLFHYNCKARIVCYASSLYRQYLFFSGRSRTPDVIAIAFLIENLSLVHRIRRCVECQRWFFAITEHQKYCGDNCRKRHAARGEEFLEKRRIYMRDYRQKQKAADIRATKLAREK